jgi:hypothetical protein
MDSSKEQFERQQAVNSGVYGDYQKLQTHGAASVAELREFLGQLKGRSPQEVMGIVAQSSLVQGIVTATIAGGVLLVAFTIIPYVIYGGPPKESSQATPAATSQPASNEVTSADDGEAATADTVSSEPDLQRAADAMGIGRAAEANPNENPLDKKLDNLLDGIE